jgi:hypothetical protein
VILLFTTATGSSANTANNPVFASISKVEQMINAAVLSIQSSITALQNQLNNTDQRVTALESAPQNQTYILVDTSNQELGTLVDGFGIGEYKTVFNTQYQKFITFHPSSGQVSPTSNLFYASNDCSGDAYVEGPWLNDYIFRVGNTTNQLAMVDTSISPALVSVHSFSDGEGCASFSENIGNAYKATLVEPYTHAVNPLFHIKIN